ncbi:hypothetical protein ABGB21_18855 [Plantactinospora sp. B24E8]
MVHGRFVRAHGQAAPLFEPVDAAFGDVALPVTNAAERDLTSYVCRLAPGTVSRPELGLRLAGTE